MGLDWVLLDRARPGARERVAQAEQELERIESSRWRSVLQAGRVRALRQELDALVESPLDAVPLPRVGTHVIADQWLREQWQQRKDSPPPATFVITAGGSAESREVEDPFRGSFDEVRARFDGMPIAELCTEADALPQWCGVAARRIDFRGQVMRGLDGIIDASLIEEAWNDHSAEEMLDYANRLEDAAAQISTTEEVTDKLQHLEIIDGAVRWLRFWGKRGFGFRAWF